MGKGKGKAKRQRLTLSDDWRVWVVDNLLRGVTREGLVSTLVDNGIPQATAAQEVDAMRTSPALVACARYRAQAARYRMSLNLRAQLRPDELVELSSPPSAVQFYVDHYEANRPFVSRGFARDWPAMSRWQLESLRARFGDVEVDVEIERDPSRRCEGRYVSMPLAELIDKVQAAGHTNDFYAIAHNKNAARPELAALHDDVVVDPALVDPARLGSATSLWIGPAGTFTPLHHDTTNVLFTQIVGRKRFRLVAPDEVAALDSLRGFYAEQLDEELLSRSFAVELAPGDALFIPVGWLHEVEALDISVSYTFMGFHRPNDFSSYEPGKRTRSG